MKDQSPQFGPNIGVSRGRHGTTITVEVQQGQLSLFPEAPRRRSLSEAWSEFWETDPPACPLRLGQGTPWPQDRRPAPALLTSLLIHLSLGFFFYNVPLTMLFHRLSRRPRGVMEAHARLVVYEFRRLSLPDYLPTVHPPGPGGSPGRGARPGPRARLGSTHFDPRITIISNPPHPDNFRQTIQNPAAPSGLRTPADLRVPDLIMGGSAPIAETARPSPPPKAAVPAPAAEHESMIPASKPVTLAPAPIPPPELALKLPAIPAPRLEVPPAPPQPEVKKATNPMPEASPAPATQPSDTKAGTTIAADTEKRPEAPKLTTLSVNPVPLKDFTSLPLGNSEGAFSISPAGAQPGSPGGVAGAPPDVGKGGGGPGGDKSVAVGKGEAGGGGPGSSVTSPSLSVTGRAGLAGIPAGTLAPLQPEALVYPVNAATLKLRAPGVVVSSGPGGGGGLRVYGVLHAEKIYTIYLPMPGKNWILQYCAHDDPPKPAPASRVVQIHLQPLLTPPRVLDQFGFHRPPVTPDPPDALIILHGLIRADGAVGNLEVFRGLEPTIDAAALAAFARWKFTPALRAGSPVAVEILVGIPAVVPGS